MFKSICVNGYLHKHINILSSILAAYMFFFKHLKSLVLQVAVQYCKALGQNHSTGNKTAQLEWIGGERQFFMKNQGP